VATSAPAAPVPGFTLSPDAPAWLRSGLATPEISGRVDIDGNPIHYLGWGWEVQERPALLLVHGFRAHAHWWSFIAHSYGGAQLVRAHRPTGSKLPIISVIH
jgi:hypothetical protein